MQKKVILFDFDGTIADTVRAGVDVFNASAERYGFLPITDENSGLLREKGPRVVMTAVSIPLFKAPFVLRRLRKGIKEKMPEIEAISDIQPVLRELKRRGYTLGIVTSNSEENVLAFLKKNDLEIFDCIQAGTSLFRKAYAIRKTIFLHQFKKADVAFVGDEIRDIEAARKNKITTVAVTWGTNSRGGLERLGPDFVVDAVEGLLGIFA